MIHMFLLPIMFLYGSEKVVDLVINSKNIGTDWRGIKRRTVSRVLKYLEKISSNICDEYIGFHDHGIRVVIAKDPVGLLRCH